MAERERLIELIAQLTEDKIKQQIIADHLIQNGVVVLPCNADEYISKSEVSRYIGIMFANAMQKINDIPPCRNPSDYLSGYSDGIKKALNTVQNFEATVVIKEDKQ